MVSSDALPELNALSPEGGGVVGASGCTPEFRLVGWLPTGSLASGTTRGGDTDDLAEIEREREGKTKTESSSKGEANMKEKQARRRMCILMQNANR